ncbi:MAG: helix-turn-helix transcriptional regulator [Anaerolineales bacterium]
MNTQVQIIKRDDKPEWAIIPYDLYLQLSEEAEMLQDIRDYDAVKDAIEHGDEELIPSQVTFAIMEGESPVKVWRKYRGLTQKQLAEDCSISAAYLSQIETKKRNGTMEVLMVIAKVLNVTLDDIVININE